MNLAERLFKTSMKDGDMDVSFLLRLFSFIISRGYGAVVQLRQTLYQKNLFQTKKLPGIVISVGNLTVGGTGKTPMTIYLARMLKRSTYHVAVISRGYQGRAERTGGVVCDGRRIFMGADSAGDEPLMIAKRLKTVPVVVGKNRFKAGMQAIKKFDSDILVLDDGFQHLELERDINLLLLDSKSPFGNGHMLPRGILREPMSSLLRADAFILTRSDALETAPITKLKNLTHGKAIFRSFHEPFICQIIRGSEHNTNEISDTSLTRDFEFLEDRRVVCFSGIARNDDFLNTIKGFGCVVTRFFDFSDHHWYSDQDINEIARAAVNTHAKFIITTEKDHVRIDQKHTWPVALVVIGVEISFGSDQDRFWRFIKSRIEESKKMIDSTGVA